ncbi:MAG TPA: hypothetical protein VKH18_05895 [Terriglobales bacterium]|nr:hypothetical protein [Terriglobales bacterium]
MTIKNLLFAAALLSLALAGGCATGGNGVVPPQPAVNVTITSPANANSNAIYPTQSLTLTATATNTTTTAVTWSLTGAGTLTPLTSTTATYVAPATVPATASQPLVTATLAADTSVKGPFAMTVVDITTDVAPLTLSVGSGLTQQFTAVGVPDDAPQTFTWTCTLTSGPGVGNACATFSQDSNVSGLAYYTFTAADSGSTGVQVSAASAFDAAGCSANPKNCTIANATLVTSRVNGTYAFRFSGYDSNNKATAVVGTFSALNGTVTSGAEDVLTASGPSAQNPIPITGGSYSPTSSDPNNSNNAGTLTLTTGTFPDKFQVVLDGAGGLEMIESDGHGTGSGIAQISAAPNVFKSGQTNAFGFTGVDSGGNRVGYAGLLLMSGGMSGGAISSGQMDSNDNGNAANICGAGPCSIASTSSYTPDQNISGLWHMVLNSGAATLKFDFFIASGTVNKGNPLTFYAISTDPVDATHPAVSGTMVLQDSTRTPYNNAALKGTSVSALTGTGANGGTNISLTLGTTDGSSTNGNGNFSGQFDQNNAGVILSYPSSAQSPFAYTYSADSSNNGRYTVQVLGNPGANPVVKPLPFVLYASGANRGFLLDQSSSSVMTGTMNPLGPGGESFAGSELPGIFGAATTASGSSAVTPIAANLIVTYPGFAAPGGPAIPNPYVVTGTQYPPYTPPLQAVAGTYTLSLSGAGTIALTDPPLPAAANYVIYVLGTSGCSSAQSPVCAIQSFFMMDEDTTNLDASIIFAQQ